MGQLEELVGKRYGDHSGADDQSVSLSEVKELALASGYPKVRIMSPGFGDCQFDLLRVTLQLDNDGVIKRVMAG